MKQTIKMPDMRQWRQNRYKVFNEKIDHFKEHPEYLHIRKQADKIMLMNEGWGYDMIVAEDFIERIEQAPLSYLSDWFNGNNELKWSEIKALTGATV